MPVKDRKRVLPSHALLAQSLGTRIATGELQPGAMLPREVELAQSEDISRSVVREALRTLAAKGLIESRPKAGTRVRARSDWNMLDPEFLSWMFSGAPPLSFVRDLFGLRLVIEPAAAALAARNRSAGQIERMGHALEEMARLGLLVEEGQKADQTFHAVLLEASNNPLIASLSASISAAVRWTTFFKIRKNRHPRDPMPEHRALYEAIVGGDEERARDTTIYLVHRAGLDTEAAIVEAEARQPASLQDMG